MLFGIGRVLSISEDNNNNYNLSSRSRADFYTPCGVSCDVRFTLHQSLPWQREMAKIFDFCRRERPYYGRESLSHRLRTVPPRQRGPRSISC